MNKINDRDKELTNKIVDSKMVFGDSLSALLRKQIVGYYYCDDIGDYQMQDTSDSKYPENMHPMKPFRIRMTHELIKAY